jgi:hypothetical protein
MGVKAYQWAELKDGLLRFHKVATEGGGVIKVKVVRAHELPNLLFGTREDHQLFACVASFDQRGDRPPCPGWKGLHARRT